MSFQSPVSKNLVIEEDKSSSYDKDKIIIKEGESAECVPTVVGTSSIQPPIISIDLDNDNSVFVGVSDSPPPQRENFHEEHVGINFDVVNTIAK